MIEIHRSDAAKMLRRTRERLNMTLKDVALGMQISPSLLARKERGEAAVERTDVRNAVEVYNLAPWEAYELWLSAGFVPEKTLPPISRDDVYALAIELLTSIKYPASLSDAAGFIQAWNSPYEETTRAESVLRNLKQTDEHGLPQVHLIDLLFSNHVRRCLGDGWETFAEQAIGRFYRQTLQVANEPFFPHLIQRLQEQYGHELIQQWNRAQTYTLPDETAGYHQYHYVVHYPPEIGEIKYLILQTKFYYSPSLELNVHMPLGEESQRRYDLHNNRLGVVQVHMIERQDIPI